MADAGSSGMQLMAQPAPQTAPPRDDEGASNGFPQALVPFSFRNPFHDALRDELRRFPIANRQIVIHQGWKNDGRGGTALGFGASVYDAAIALSLYLDAHPDVIRGKRVIELGCGPGLVGIVAGHLEPQSIVLTDGDPASVALTRENAVRNDLEASHCSVAEYLWGDAASPLVSPPHAPFDVILGADIAACPYAGAFEDLLRAFAQLSDTRTVLLLAYKRRHDSEDAFFTALALDFEVEPVPRAHLHPDFSDSDIEIFRARRRR